MNYHHRETVCFFRW